MCALKKARDAGSRRDRKETEMVYFEDRGSVFDAPIGAVWDYITKANDLHSNAHRDSLRKFKWRSLSEITGEGTCEVVRGGRWTKVRFRATNIPPFVRINEEFAGRYAGLKMVCLYTSKGDKTAVDVFVLSPRRVAEEIRRTLEQTFEEDAPAVRAFFRSQRRKAALQ